MMIRILIATLLGALVWPAFLSAQEFVELPAGTWVTDITPDGSLVVGYGSGGGFHWRWQVDSAPTYIGGNDASAVSDDGSVIVGCIQDAILDREVAARWTQATGWVSLGYLPSALSCPSRSNAYDVSADGSTVVGLSWDGCDGRGFRWTQANGMQELMALANGQNRASAISGDGSAIGGFAQGSFSRTPAYWNPDTSGAVINQNVNGEVNGFTEDGSLSVGTLHFSGNFYSAFLRTAGGNTTNLGALNPSTMAGNAQDLSEDGNTVVGFDHIQLTREAWVWTSSDGIISLNDRLAALGVAGVPPLLVCTAVSDDGNVVVGGYDPDGIAFSGGFVANLGTDTAVWQNLGGGTFGVNGVPHLTGSGTLVGGTPVTIAIENGPGSALTLAWVSFAPTPLGYFGGTVWAIPHNLQFLFNTTPGGNVTLPTTWPAGVPADTEIWFQFLCSDPSVLSDITLSNGLKATTP